MKTLPLLAVAAAALCMIFSPVPVATATPNDKVVICHIPPGNPDNAQTITVGSDAVAAHLAHGDVLGACVAF